ncbi:unnamed protein product [Coffea canephora]|uniref:Prohibitin n=1 Tax=Coffea canephora TaxID=49390 RepID=A0A068VFR4_COFCA|nr:unnamed protein product [Coffea canephora]
MVPHCHKSLIFSLSFLRDVAFNRIIGVKKKVNPEGTHFMIPWFETPIIYDIRVCPHMIEGTSGSHDL